MKRIQGLYKVCGKNIIERFVAGQALSVGGNFKKYLVRGFSSIIEIKTQDRNSIQMRYDIPVRKMDTMSDVECECWGAAPQAGSAGGAGWSHGYLPSATGSFYGIASGGINQNNPYASPTSHPTAGGTGGGFGGVFNVSLQNPSPVVRPQTLLVAGGTGVSNNAGFGMGGGPSGSRGRPANDPRSNGPGSGGGPNFTNYKLTSQPGSNPTSGDNNNTPGGGAGGAGYYGGGGGRRGSDGGEGTRANNGGGGGSGYVSPIVLKGETVSGLSTFPAGQESVNYPPKHGASQPDNRNSRVVINRQY